MHGCNTASSGKSCHCSCLEPANWTSIWAILALCRPNAVEVIIIKAIPCTCSAAKLYIYMYFQTQAKAFEGPCFRLGKEPCFLIVLLIFTLIVQILLYIYHSVMLNSDYHICIPVSLHLEIRSAFN